MDRLNQPSSNNTQLNASNNTELKLKITAINVNSLVSHAKRFEFLQFIEIHNPDVVLISETKLSEIHKISFADYNIIRTDRRNKKGGGGTAVLLHNKFHSKIINHIPFLPFKMKF